MALNADSYYKIGIETAQEITIKGSFNTADGTNLYSSGSLHFYDGSKDEWDYIYGGTTGILGPWLSKSDKTLYIRMENDSSDEILTYDVEIILQDRFDAGSKTDAGDMFDSALPISIGNYTGYKSGLSVMQTPYGDDFKDYYKISVLKGVNYQFKLTPPSEVSGELELFNKDRESVDDNASANDGALTSIFLTPISDMDVFLVVGSGYAKGIVDYKLEIISTEKVTEYFSCNNGSCESVGKFVSLDECQKNTTKTCSKTSNCDGKCGVDGSFMCSKNSDCPTDTSCVSGSCVGNEGFKPDGHGDDTCQDKCSVNQTECFDNFNYSKCGNYNDDSCLELSTPVYCGEGNQCSSGECIKAEGCQCSAWEDSECGETGCPEGQMAKTRTCTPAACDIENTCQEDSSCGSGWSGSFFKMGWFGPMKGLGWLFGLYIFLMILFYVYMAISLQVIAKKTNTENGWMAWIPIANFFLMINIAKKPLWWFILLLIPLVNLIIGILLWMAIAERRGKPNWVGILLIVPVVGICIPGYLAFSKDGTVLSKV